MFEIVKMVDLARTIFWGWWRSRRWTSAHFVDSRHSEFIRLSIFQATHSVCCLFDVVILHFPLVPILLHFQDIVSNGCTSIILWHFPGDSHRVIRSVLYGGNSRFSRFIEWILGDKNTSCFWRLTESGLIFSDDPEFVFSAFNKVLEGLGCCCDWIAVNLNEPGAESCWLFDVIALDWRSTIECRWFPGNGTPCLANIVCLYMLRWWRWFWNKGTS